MFQLYSKQDYRCIAELDENQEEGAIFEGEHYYLQLNQIITTNI